MTKDRKVRTLAIVAVLVSILALGVGFSALNQALTINSTTKIKVASWDLHFEPLDNKTVNYVMPSLTGAAKDITGVSDTVTTGTGAKVEATSITLAAELSQPGDKAVYEFQVVNDGTINATLSSITGLEDLSDYASKNVNFTLEYDGKSVTSVNDVVDKTLNAEASKTIKLTVEYDKNTTEEQLEALTQDVKINKTIVFNYVQAN